MAKTYYETTASNLTLLPSPQDRWTFREDWTIPNAHIYYAEDEQEEIMRSLGMGVVSNVVFWVSLASQYLGFLGDNVKKDIVDLTNLQLNKLV